MTLRTITSILGSCEPCPHQLSIQSFSWGAVGGRRWSSLEEFSNTPLKRVIPQAKRIYEMNLRVVGVRIIDEHQRVLWKAS